MATIDEEIDLGELEYEEDDLYSGSIPEERRDGFFTNNAASYNFPDWERKRGNRK